MGFDIRIAHTVAEIGPEAWNRLSGGQPFASYRWYCYGEAALAESGCRPTYVMLLDAGEPVARGTFWLKHAEWVSWGPAPMRWAVAAMLRRWPLFACEAPLLSQPGLILLPPPRRAEALQTIIATALELSRQQGAAFVLFSYLQPEMATADCWPNDWTCLSMDSPGMHLPIVWPDFESYLKALAKSTRRNYRLHCRRAEELGLSVRFLPAINDMAEALRLIRRVETFHGSGPNPRAAGMLKHLELAGGTWIAVQRGERLLGECCLLGDGEEMEACLLGLDYDFSDYVYVYYQVMYAAVRGAIERGARRLWGGSSAEEFKRRLKFEPASDTVMAMTTNGPPVIKKLVRRLARWAVAL